MTTTRSVAGLPLEAIDVYEVIEPSFGRLRGDVGARRLTGGQRRAEGPVYVPAGCYLLWNDIPNDRLMRWDETDGSVSAFPEPAGYPNGNALDAQGRLLTCEQGLRQIVRTEHDGRRGEWLYVADSRANHLPAFSGDGATAAGSEVIFANTVGNVDSMAVDRTRRIWLAAGDGVHCLTPDGDLIGKIRLPEAASNVEFGGPRRNCLFITASTSVYSIMLTVHGAARAYDGSGA